MSISLLSVTAYSYHVIICNIVEPEPGPTADADARDSCAEQTTSINEMETSEVGSQTELVATACVEQMESMFLDILNSSSLSEEERESTRREYTKHLQELKRSL